MVRKLPALLAALLAAIGAGALAVTLSSGSSHREAPLTSLDPTADDTDVYAFTAADAPDALTIVANWIPFEDPGRRPELLPVRRPRGRTTSTSTTPATAGSTSATASSSRRRSSTRTRSCTRCPAWRRSATRSSTSSRRTRSRARRTATASETGHTVLGTDLPVAPNNVGPKTFPNYAAVAGAGDRGTSTAAARCSSARPTTRSSSTSARRSTRSTSARAPATRAAARTTSRATTSTRSSCRSPRRRSRATGKPVSGPKAPNAVVGVWASTNRERVAVSAAPGFGPSTKTLQDEGAKGQDEGEVQVSRLGNPLVNEVVIPLGPEGPLQRDAAVRRPEELRQVRPLAGAREGHQRAVPGPQRARRRTARTSSRRC